MPLRDPSGNADLDDRIQRYTVRLRAAGYYEAVVRTTPVIRDSTITKQARAQQSI